MKVSEKKYSDYEAKVFLHNENLKRKNSKMSGSELRILSSADFGYKTFRIINFWGRNIFQKLSFWIQFLLRKQVSMKNSHLKKKRFDSFCSAANNKFFTLRALFKRHDLVANFFIENQSLKRNFQKKRNQILKQTFSCTMKFWKEKIPKSQVLNWEFFVPAYFEYKTFRIFIFWRRNFFQKLSFWIQFLLRNQVSMKNSNLKEKRFDSICSADNNKFFTLRAHFKRHDFVANSFIENQSLKWNFPKKRIRFWSKRFPVQWKFEKKKFQNVRFWIENFSFRQISNTKHFEYHILEKKFFPETQFLNSIFNEKSGFDEKFTSEKKHFDSICSAETTSFSVCVLILKGMTLYKLSHWKSEFEMKLSEKKKQILKQTFSCTKKIWKGKFPKCQVFNWEFFIPADFENKIFEYWICGEKVISEK